MIESNLPSPDIGGKGFHLRRIAAQAISALEVTAAGYTNGIHPARITLLRFFAACIDGALGNVHTMPIIDFTPNAKTYSVAAGATAGPTVDKNGSAGALTYSSSNTGVATVNSSTGAVTGVAPGTCRINVDIASTATYRAMTRSYAATVTA